MDAGDEDDEPGRLEFDLDAAPALEALLLRMPCTKKGVRLRKLLPGEEFANLLIASELILAGIIVICG
jgi:hypothetical protein